jgi:uncharacterized protein (TIGR04255 family)
MPRKTPRTHRLPKAPLIEVVFELRWTLQGGPDAPSVLRSDPALLPLIDRFTATTKKLGFAFFRDMSKPLETGGYGVARRFYKGVEAPFPILQVGPGIFASNEGPLYQWRSFKAQTVRGVRALIEAYPKLGFFSLEPIYLELRYIDVFDKWLLGKASLFHFVAHGTSLKFELPPMLNDRKLFEGDPVGRFGLTRRLKCWEGSTFMLDFASSKTPDNKEDVIRLESKVSCNERGVPKLKTNTKFLQDVDQWLEFAHGITSPFFKALLLPEIMDKFKEERNGH